MITDGSSFVPPAAIIITHVPAPCATLLLLQLGCSLAIILIVRNSLYKVTIAQVSGQLVWSMQCLAATSSFPGACE